ncbi:hypothetical protein APHAL10511_007805 [Amanita phalloides]|nr:hypothetical protein APHAL10511_007805 [Amanita phalloides]
MVSTKWKVLKSSFTAISSYHSSSGLSWNTWTGADIQTPSEAVVFEVFVKSSTAGRRVAIFKNNGWPLYELLSEIIQLGTTACGDFAFHPGMSSTPPAVEYNEETDTPAIVTMPNESLPMLNYTTAWPQSSTSFSPAMMPLSVPAMTPLSVPAILPPSMYSSIPAVPPSSMPSSPVCIPALPAPPSSCSLSSHSSLPTHASSVSSGSKWKSSVTGDLLSTHRSKQSNTASTSPYVILNSIQGTLNSLNDNLRKNVTPEATVGDATALTEVELCTHLPSQG